MVIKRVGAKCKGCPLNGMTTKVWGCSEDATRTPKIVFVGEAPGSTEEQEGVPFVGAAGRLLGGAIARAGYRKEACYLTNTICCRPPGNNISSPEAIEAIRRCRPGLEAELTELVRRGTRVICALGNTAGDALVEEMKRGYLYEGAYGVPLMKTFHPSYILRGMSKEEPTWINDLAKVLSVSQDKIKLIKPSFSMFPSIEEIEHKADKLIQKDAIIAVDIETVGFLPGQAKIIVVGIGTSDREAFSIPFLKQGAKPYWDSEEKRLRALIVVQRLMQECRVVMQNAPFDMAHLAFIGAPVLRLEHDLLLAHHAMSPELPHNLEYIASVHGSTPNWKTAVKGDARRMVMMEDAKLRSYNLCDCIVLFQCLPSILKELEEDGLTDVYYKRSMPLIPVVHEMTTAGLKLDSERLVRWKAELQEKQIETTAKLKKLTGVTEGFNWSSGPHLRALFYGEKPESLQEKLDDIASYDEPGTRKKKATKRYRELVEYVDAFTAVPLVKPKVFIPSKTDTGQSSTDELALMRLGIAVSNRVGEIKALKKKNASVELRGLTQTLDVISQYGELQKTEKLLSTYTDFPTAADGRVHPFYKIHGTATGRLSSSNPNMQNVPEEAKECFIPEAGWGFVEADFSNIELRVLALASKDDVLQAMFDQGLSVHDENCKALFEIDKDHPDWKLARHAIKTTIFGLVYGGTMRGIFEKVAIQVPTLGLTFKRFEEIMAAYFALHPAYVRWIEATNRQITETRCVETAYGRKRYLLGDERDILREGPNAIIQGTASEIVLESVVWLLDAFKGGTLQAYRPRIVSCIHDSVTIECHSSVMSAVAGLTKHILERPRILEKWDAMNVTFPVDLKTGTENWGKLTKWEGVSNEGARAIQQRRKTSPIHRRRGS